MAELAGEFDFPTVELPAAACISPETAVRFLVAKLAQQDRLELEHVDSVVHHVLGRELLGATTLSGGVALPHGQSDSIEDVLGLFARAQVPIQWPGAADRKPVHTVCLLVTPTSKPGTNIRALGGVAKRFREGESLCG